MTMIILGDTPQHKGKQLEALTRHLLEARNFKELTVNVMANGSELDVTGVYELPSLSVPVKHKAICECKAIKDTIDITQWLKFLGKLFHYEKTENDQYIGCFIALSGVNGYVQDNFNSLRNNKIQLLTGDNLTNVVVEFYKAINRSQVASILAGATARIPRSSELTLYNHNLFWTVQLSDNEFTIVGSDGSVWSANDHNARIIGLVHQALDGSQFVDLNKEAKAIQRRKDVESVLVALLIEMNGEQVPLKELIQVPDIPFEEIADAARTLREKGVIELKGFGDKLRATLPIVQRGGLRTIPLTTWRILCDGKIHLMMIDSKLADDLINDAFLDDVSALHGNLPIPPDRRSIWITILRLCKEAVKHVVNHIEGISNRVREQPEMIDLMDRTLIEREMLDKLRTAYRTIQYGALYYKKHDIHEIEATTTVTVKTSRSVLFDCTVNERHMLAPADASFGGIEFIPVLLKPDWPQPWEPKPGEKVAGVQ